MMAGRIPLESGKCQKTRARCSSLITGRSRPRPSTQTRAMPTFPLYRIMTTPDFLDDGPQTIQSRIKVSFSSLFFHPHSPSTTTRLSPCKPKTRKLTFYMASSILSVPDLRDPRCENAAFCVPLTQHRASPSTARIAAVAAPRRAS